MKRITLDGKDITNRPLKLDRVSDWRGIAVEISPGAAEIRGAIHAESCQQHAVYAVSLDRKSNEIQFVRRANCSGNSFRIQSLAPGRYYVVEIASSDHLDHCKREPCTRQRGIDDKHYDAIEQVIASLLTKGTKALTLNHNQIQDNIKPVQVDFEIGLTIKV